MTWTTHSHLKKPVSLNLQTNVFSKLTPAGNNDDLEYYVRECADILGINEKLEGRKEGRDVLAYVLKAIANWKKLS